MRAQFSYRLLLLGLAIVLYACSAAPPPKMASIPKPSAPITTAPNAEQLLELAAQSTGAQADNYRLQAVALLLDKKHIAKAGRVLTGMAQDTSDFDAALYAQYAELHARWLLLKDRPADALNQLSEQKLLESLDLLATNKQVAISFLRAQALEQQSFYLAGARERIFIDPLITTEQERKSNRETLWNDLLAIPAPTLERYQAQAELISDDFKAWIELALLYKNERYDLADQAQHLRSWRTDWSNHPAARQLPDEINLINTLATDLPKRIAVLLPLSGPLAASGKAIRDGLLAASYQRTMAAKDTPVLDIIDTYNKDFVAIYQQAVGTGADSVVGPLAKDNVRSLIDLPELPVPTLALNYVNDYGSPPQALFQFGLAAEDEARQIALLAQQQGYQRALILAPESDWGARVSTAFRTHWQSRNGIIVETVHYENNGNHSRQIKEALQLSTSEQRVSQIRNLLGISLETRPHRREDIDVIFLIALPDEARALKPLLSFHYAGDIPVYATSHINIGNSDPDRDSDLNGILFTEVPWLLDTNNPTRELLMNTVGPTQLSYSRLYALGYDSFQLLPRLTQLRQSPSSRLFGMTGTLRMNDRRQIERELRLAQIKDGLITDRDTLGETLTGTDHEPETENNSAQ